MQNESKSGSIFTEMKNKVKAFDSASKRNQRITYYSVYTIIFCLAALAVYSSFIIGNKSFIWRTDGVPVNYNVLVYYGDYIRSAINSFFTTGSLNFPMWDFHIGYGSDILTTLNFTVMGDPLNLLAVFFKGDSNEILFNFLVILRLYLAGIAFSSFCRKMGKSRFYILIGALIYVFCGYSLFVNVRHPYFVNTMIYLPLLLIGVEKILEKGKPHLFITMVCVSIISNFYFFYMHSILTAGYAIVRFLTYYKENRAKQFFKSFLKFCVSYGVGVLLSAVVLLPVVISFLNNGRLQSGYSNNFLYYSLNYYLNFIPSFITIVKDYFYCEAGYTSIALIAIILLFSAKNKYRGLKLTFVVLTLFLLIPAFGFLFNGFAYVTNRWIFGYSLLISFITVEMLPEFFSLDNKKKAVLAVSSVILYIFCAIYNWKIETIIITGIFVITAFAIIIFNGIYNKKGKSGAYKTAFRGFVLVLTLGGIIFNAAFRYTPLGQNYSDEFIEAGKGIESIEKTPNIALKNVNDSSFYRVETDYTGTDYVDWKYNDSMQLKFNGTNIYFGIVSNNISRYFKELGGYLDKNLNAYQFGGMDDRAALSAAACVKYYTVEDGREAHVPYGFRFLTSFNGYSVYENENTLPLGFTYSNYITSEEYKNMSMDEKQQSILQGIVLENPLDGYEKGQPVFNDINLPYDVKCGDGISFSKESISVTKENAEMTLTFKGAPDSETYLIFSNLWYDGQRGNGWDNPVDANIMVNSDRMSKKIICRTPRATTYYNIHDFMVNMGYLKENQTNFILSFTETGKYTFDDLGIVCIPMNVFSSQVESLKVDSMENIIVKENNISGEVDIDKDKILCLSVPYSEGWSAKVNGESVKILQANTMYMAIPLKAGKNIVELEYMTPGLKYGIIISGLTLLVLIGISLYLNIKKRNKKTDPV